MLACQPQAEKVPEVPLVCPDGSRVAGGAPKAVRPEGLGDGRMLWCEVDGAPSGPWVTLHDDGRVASKGEFRDGAMFGPFEAWWSNGKRALAFEEGQLVIHDEGGVEVTRYPAPDGVPVACPEGTREVTESRVRRCEKEVDGERVVHGIQTTTWPDGTWESRVLVVEGKPQGLLVGWHESGKPWMRGELALGKKHGPWTTWNGDGAPLLEGTEKADEKPPVFPTWLDPETKDAPPSETPGEGLEEDDASEGEEKSGD